MYKLSEFFKSCKSKGRTSNNCQNLLEDGISQVNTMVQHTEVGLVAQGETKNRTHLVILGLWFSLSGKTCQLTCGVDSDLTGVEVTRGPCPEGGVQ